MSKYETLIEYDKTVDLMNEEEVSRISDLLIKGLIEHPEGYNEGSLEHLRKHVGRFCELIRNLGRVKLYFSYDIFSGVDSSRFSSIWLNFKPNGIEVKWTGDSDE